MEINSLLFYTADYYQKKPPFLVNSKNVMHSECHLACLEIYEVIPVIVNEFEIFISQVSNYNISKLLYLMLRKLVKLPITIATGDNERNI